MTILVSLSIALFLAAGAMFIAGASSFGCAFVSFGFASSIALIAYVLAMIHDRIE